MKKKYKLMKGIMISSIIGGIVLNSLIPQNTKNKNISYYNNSDNKKFEEELNRIEQTDSITFTNKELYDIVASKVDGNLTTENIKEIKTIVIGERLSNQDLSDLKYLTNLKFLIIKDNDIDATDLQYNQELIGLKIERGSIKNTNNLPNSLINIRLSNTNVKDYYLSLPYNLEELNINRTPINNINAKNKESLKTLKINGDVYFSTECLQDLSNLWYLSIKNCSSLKEPEYLCNIPKLKVLLIDEYASIWLDKETLNKLPIFPLTKVSLDKKINELNKIADSLRDDSLSDIELITKITEYLVNRYCYNKEVSDNTIIGQFTSTIDNVMPITSSLKHDDIICINYATMFQAIANRLDIESVLLINDIHAWNAYNIDGEYQRIDITNIDSYLSKKGITDITTEWISMNSFNPTDYRPLYEGAVYPLEYEDIDTKLGYIKQEDNPKNLFDILENELMNLIYNKMTFNIYAYPEGCIVPTLILIDTFIIYKMILSNRKVNIENKSLKKNKKNNN